MLMVERGPWEAVVPTEALAAARSTSVEAGYRGEPAAPA